MVLSPHARLLGATLFAVTLSVPLRAQSTPKRPGPTAITGVQLSGMQGSRTLLLRDGLIERILPPEQEVPAAYTRVDGEGLLAVPAFVDAFSHAGCVTPEPQAQQDRPVDTGSSVRIDMRLANRKGIQPGFRSAKVLELPDDVTEAYRKAGFGALVSAPHGQMLAGMSSLAVTRDAARRDQLVLPEVFAHAAFRASGSGYPGTLMGMHAQLRQTFLDAAWLATTSAAFEAGKSGVRPPHDPELQETRRLLDGKATLFCEVTTARDVNRWLRLADEFSLQLGFTGGRDAWKVADKLRERDIPVVLTLEWGEEVEDPNEAEKEKEQQEQEPEEGAQEEPPEEQAQEPSKEGAEEQGEVQEAEQTKPQEAQVEEPSIQWKYQEPKAVRADKRARWLERRDCALRLSEDGVRILFGSAGEKPGELLKRVRTLVKEGLPREVALNALTTHAAELLGVDRHFGWLKEGHGANLCLWTADPFDEKSQVRWAFVDGMSYEFEVEEKKAGEGPAEGIDLSGTWTLTDPENADDPPYVMELSMDKAGEVSGTILGEDPSGEELRGEISGSVSADEFELETSFAMQGQEIDVTLEGKIEGDSIEGDVQIQFMGQKQEQKFKGKREPKSAQAGPRGGVR